MNIHEIAVEFPRTQAQAAQAAATAASAPKVYRALLTQSGTNAPVATVLENSLGGQVVWSYNAAGDYRGTLSGAFPSGKTFLLICPVSEATTNIGFGLTRLNDSVIYVSTSNAGGNGEDSCLQATALEILVYP